MSIRRMELPRDLELIRKAFKETLMEAEFIVAVEEDLSDGFRVLAVNKKRRSMLFATLLSLVGGYIPGKRVAIELAAQIREGSVAAVLRCFPYIDTLDMMAKAETPKELETCAKLARLFDERIHEKLT